MISETEARGRILDAVTRKASTNIRLGDALGFFSAETVHAKVPLPGFDNSSMDGYAVLAAETEGGSPLKVMGEQPAGPDLHLTLQTGNAIRIFTGAPMPSGADAVIMQEDVEVLENGKVIVCKEPVTAGENIRRAGCDLCVGQRILAAGDRLTPARLAVLASQGLAQIQITSRPRLGVLTTGDELVEAGLALQAGQIYNSNATLLTSLAQEHGVTEITRRHVRDDLQQTLDALRELMAGNDVVLLSGGVSVGDRDFIKPALEKLGVKLDFWRIKMQPGKPLLFAKFEDATGRPCLFFGLPGNPVSAFVTFQVFVRPALLKMMGAPESAQMPPLMRTTLAQPLVNKGDRPHYLRGRVVDGKFTIMGMQQSHALFGLSQADALLRLEPGAALEAGAEAFVSVVG
jgi:molybdopterin molybdotransferase